MSEDPLVKDYFFVERSYFFIERSPHFMDKNEEIQCRFLRENLFSCFNTWHILLIYLFIFILLLCLLSFHSIEGVEGYYCLFIYISFY